MCQTYRECEFSVILLSFFSRCQRGPFFSIEKYFLPLSNVLGLGISLLKSFHPLLPPIEMFFLRIALVMLIMILVVHVNYANRTQKNWYINLI